MNYIQSLGSIAIASRLKSLSELLIRDMAQVYIKQNIDFEARWFTILHLIYNRGPMAITSIAMEVNQTHPAVNQVANALEKKGLIKSLKDDQDHRKRIITLSAKGKELLVQLKPIWYAVERAVNRLLNESTPDLLSKISRVEEKITERSMEMRILKEISKGQHKTVKIINYDKRYNADFKRLNEAWLISHFEIEESDALLLNNPEEQIIQKGGLIIFAYYESIIIGTGALLRIDKDTCELTKMAVSSEYQGLNAGRLLLKEIILKATMMQFKKMILLTSEKLYKAVSLYRSQGFNVCGQRPSPSHNLKRCSIQMELTL